MITSYPAIVEFPMGDQPYDAGYGPSYNVALKILDANGNQITDLPKAKKDGLIPIYKSVDREADIEYMRTLSKGDKITVTLSDGKWDFAPDPNWRNNIKETPSATSVTQSATQTSDEYKPMTQTDKDILKDFGKSLAEVTVDMAISLKERLEEVGMEVPHADILRTASGFRISAERNVKPGMKWGDSDLVDVSQKDFDKIRSKVLDGNLDGTIDTALEEIAKLAPIADYDVAKLRNHLRQVDAPHDMFSTNDGVIEAAEIIWQMLELIAGGMEESAAISATRESFKDTPPW